MKQIISDMFNPDGETNEVYPKIDDIENAFGSRLETDPLRILEITPLDQPFSIRKVTERVH